MSESAIFIWLNDEFSRRFQEKASEGLTTLVWFDPHRYWLPSISGLMAMAAKWSITVGVDEEKAPLKLIMAGPDLSGAQGRSPLQIRLDIIADRLNHSGDQGLKDWRKTARWIVYCPYPPDWLNEATRPKKTLPLSWLMPFCEAGLEWARRGGDEDKLPAFFRARGVDITNDKKQLEDLYHISKPDRSSSPIARLVAKNLEMPPDFWLRQSWDLKAVQLALIGNLGRQTEELLVDPEGTLRRLKNNGALQDFLDQLETSMGKTWSAEEAMANPHGFCRMLVRHVALCATWKLTDFNPSFPFTGEMAPPYKTDVCQEAIRDWQKVTEVGQAYVGICRSLENEGLNLTSAVDVRSAGHVFPHLILSRWIEERKALEEAVGTSVSNIRMVLRKSVVEDYDRIWDRLLPGELGWSWLGMMKEMEDRISAGEAWLMGSGAEYPDALIGCYINPQEGWQRIDDLFRRLTAQAVDDPQGDLIRALALPVYNEWIGKLGWSFTQALVRMPDFNAITKASPVKNIAAAIWSVSSGQRRKAVLCLDALRYDLALDVALRLERFGFVVQVRPCLADLPTKTEIGMSRLLPGDDMQVGVSGGALSVTAQGKDLSLKSNRIEYLKQKLGKDAAFLDIKDVTAAGLKAIKAKMLVLFSRDIDLNGEAKGLGIVKDIEKEIAEIVQKIRVLVQGGYPDIHVLTDHGFLLGSGGEQTKWDAPPSAIVCDRRFALVPKAVGTDLPAVSWLWDEDFWLVIPPARTVFKAPGQTEYLHGGASLQELVIPYLHAEAQEQVRRVTVSLHLEREVVDSGVVKVLLKGETPADQISLAFMPTVVLPRSGQLVVMRQGKIFSQQKSFEIGPDDQLTLTLFLERGLKQGDELDVIIKDGDEVLAMKKMKVIRDV